MYTVTGEEPQPFWADHAPEDGRRGYMAGFTLHCPDCGRFARIVTVGSIIPPSGQYGWRDRCMFQVFCKKDGLSTWIP